MLDKKLNYFDKKAITATVNSDVVKTGKGDSIGNQLRGFQNGKCCFCGLNYDETGQGQIEHIAPKKARPNEKPIIAFSTNRRKCAMGEYLK